MRRTCCYLTGIFPPTIEVLVSRSTLQWHAVVHVTYMEIIILMSIKSPPHCPPFYPSFTTGGNMCKHWHHTLAQTNEELHCPCTMSRFMNTFTLLKSAKIGLGQTSSQVTCLPIRRARAVLCFQRWNAWKLVLKLMHHWYCGQNAKKQLLGIRIGQLNVFSRLWGCRSTMGLA